MYSASAAQHKRQGTAIAEPSTIQYNATVTRQTNRSEGIQKGIQKAQRASKKHDEKGVQMDIEMHTKHVMRTEIESDSIHDPGQYLKTLLTLISDHFRV